VVVGSILLVVTAAGLLVAGLAYESDYLYYGSIVASVLAALALMVGVRQLPANRVPEDDFDVGPPPPDLVEDGEPALAAAAVGRAGVPPAGMAGSAGLTGDADPSLAGQTGQEPPDEPAAQDVTAAATAKIGRLTTPVVVIDGRPRYHVPECLHLLGRDGERLPAAEAVELGFTPCSQCSAASVLLAGGSTR
jgi:hypothetical protein